MAISEEDIEKWLQTNNSRMIGRGYEVAKKGDRVAFKSWLISTVEEIERAAHNQDE